MTRDNVAEQGVMDRMPRVTFGIIVLNGEPFTRYCLRSLYPFAHQIIIVEGAAPGAASIATTDGHSTDGTLDTLQDFAAREDPDKKVAIITAEDEGHPNGFWPGEKHEQSQAYARRTTGDYLWQVDIDEFYREEDVYRILAMLREQPDITAVSFKQISFWGGFAYYTDGWHHRRSAANIHRLFRWEEGSRYLTHRPPTVVNANQIDARTLRWISGRELARQGIFLYHYALVFPKQVLETCAYYGTADWARRTKANEWARTSYTELKRPFRVHNVYDLPSWLVRFQGRHPGEIRRLQEDLQSGRLDIDLRRTDDVERLLESRSYAVKRELAKGLEPIDRLAVRIRLLSLRLAMAVKAKLRNAMARSVRS